MNFVIFTGCTSRKTVPPLRRLTAGDLSRGSIEELASDWASRIASEPPEVPAARLYSGRAFREAVTSAKSCGSGLYVISAGLGSVSADTIIPSYSLTVSKASVDSILQKIEGEKKSPADWWKQIAQRSKIGTDINSALDRYRNHLILISLSSVYVRMIEGDLLQISETLLRRLRIFSRISAAALDERLRPLVMPYDDRLDSSQSPIRGTRSDFAQRALRHFVEVVLPVNPVGSVEQHARDVKAALQGWTAPRLQLRTRATDAEIVELIREHWHAAQGQSGRMLRLLRDDLGVACEQTRLSHLLRAVRSEQGLYQ